VTLHHREQDHRGTEDCSTVVIERPIGRYQAGASLCDVLGDLIRRSIDVRNHYHMGFHAFWMDAFVAPYAPAGTLRGVFDFSAWIHEVSTSTFSLSAALAAPTTQERTNAFWLESWFISLYNDAITVLIQPVSPTNTVIHVGSNDGFPSVPFLIQIGTETMVVIAVNGNEWTVVRDYPQNHAVGSYVVVC
jgi:hypothetical protein